MAVTAGSIQPIKPAATFGTSQGSVPIVQILMADAQTVLEGDAVTMDTSPTTGLGAVPASGAVATGTLLGFALEAKASASTGDFEADRQLPVALALPGVMFEGNIVGQADGDLSPTTAGEVLANRDLVRTDNTPNAYMAVDDAQSVNAVVVTGYTLNQANATSDGRSLRNALGTAGNGVVNPRVNFLVVDSVWTSN